MSKYNIKKGKESLSSEDISKNMDFDKFYSGYQAASAAGKSSWLSKTAKIYLSATAIVVVTATFVIYKSINGKAEKSGINAFINPPLPELNVSSDNFLVDNSKDTTIVYKSGTVLYMPAKAFKRKDGKDSKNKVKICYREFRDPVDFIFSGIPMDYDSAGVKSPFESAGMFEVLAYENDSVPLELKEGKTLNVNFLSDNTENKFNVYYLDTVARRWNHQFDETRNHRNNMDKLIREKEEFLAKHNLQDPDKLLTPKKANAALDNFTIDYNKDEFPELAVYDGVKFEVAANEKNYTPEFKNTVWEDVFISRHPDGKNYILTFKVKKQSASITATPVFDDKNFEAAMKEYEKIRLSQVKRIQAQADSLKRLDQDANAHLSRSNDINTRFNAYAQAGSIYRSIIVSRMGIWNFDHPIRNEEIYTRKNQTKSDNDVNYYGSREDLPTAYFVSSETGKKIPVFAIFFMKRDVNARFPVSPGELIDFPVGLVNTTDILVAITFDRRVYFLKDEALHNTKVLNNEITFALKHIDCSLNENDRSFRVSNTMAANLEKIKNAIDLQ